MTLCNLKQYSRKNIDCLKNAKIREEVRLFRKIANGQILMVDETTRDINSERIFLKRKKESERKILGQYMGAIVACFSTHNDHGQNAA